MRSPTDLAYLTPGQSLFEQLIESICGIVEIEQAKREERTLAAESSLEKTIQIVGIGLGSGAIVSGVVTEHIDKPFLPINSKCPTNSKCPIHPLVSSLFWSVVATIFFGLLGWCLTVWREKKN